MLPQEGGAAGAPEHFRPRLSVAVMPIPGSWNRSLRSRGWSPKLSWALASGPWSVRAWKPGTSADHSRCRGPSPNSEDPHWRVLKLRFFSTEERARFALRVLRSWKCPNDHYRRPEDGATPR